MPPPRKEDVEVAERQWMDARNKRKRDLRLQKRLASKSVDKIRSNIVHKMMNTVICKVRRRAKDRQRRCAYVQTHKEEEAASASERHKRLKAERLAAPAACDETGVYMAVSKVAAAAISHVKALANARYRAKINRPRDSKRIYKRKRERKQSEPQYALIERARVRLHSFLKVKHGHKKGKTKDLLACTAEELRDHLQWQRPDDDIRQQVMDHIFPLDRQDMTFLGGQKRAMHFSNLQPLTAEENSSKRDKLPTKAMAAKVERWAWPPGITEDMLPDIYDGWATPLRMRAD